MKTILFIVVLLGLSCSLFGWGYEFYNDLGDMQRILFAADRISDRHYVHSKNRLDKTGMGILDSLDAKSSLTLKVTISPSDGKCWVESGVYANELVGKQWYTFYHFIFDEKDSLILQIRWAAFLVYRDSDFNTIYYNRRKTVFAFNKKKVGKEMWFGTDEDKRLNDYYWTYKLLRLDAQMAFGLGFIIEVISKDKKGIKDFLKMYKSFSAGSDSVVSHNLRVFYAQGVY